MKTLLIAVAFSLLSGCAILESMGIGASDVLPSLKYCHHVDYERKGIDMKIKAECRVPAG